MDLMLAPDNERTSGDLLFRDGALVTDGGLSTAIYISLMTDRRARQDDELPAQDGHRRGWWSDQYHDDSADQIGSRLWLLWREKRTNATLRKAEDYGREALAWLSTDGWAEAVELAASWVLPVGTLALDITVTRPGREDLLLHYEISGDAHAV